MKSDCSHPSPGHADFSLPSIQNAELPVRKLLDSDKKLGQCALIVAEIDNLPQSNEGWLEICRQTDACLVQFFTDHSVIARSDSIIMIFANSLSSAEFAKNRLGQLCYLLGFTYEDGGAA